LILEIKSKATGGFVLPLLICLYKTKQTKTKLEKDG
jgi:hypothetical protein